MSSQLEIERKFLVHVPTSWGQLSELMDNIIDIKRISQSYLKQVADEPSARIRKTVEGLVGDKETVYHYNKKRFIEDGVHKETEFEISKEKYNKLLKDSRPDMVELNKTRFVFKYNDQVFELDLFKGPLKGLAILEIELKDKDETVELPHYLKVIEEVTDAEEFNNFNLASKKLTERINASRD
jgi:adenylate cyclase